MRFVSALVLLAACATAPPRPPAPPAPPPAKQNPSPMVDSTRAHQRVEQREPRGRRVAITGVLEKAVEVLATPAVSDHADIVIHFHGASWLPMQAAEETERPLVIASVNLGAGSRRYSIPFEDPAAFVRLRERIASEVPKADKVYLTGFSAGYGAIREILRQRPDEIDGVLLLDGLHAGYVPDGKPLADGGTIDAQAMEPFFRYAERAVRGETRFVVTHSEIFPGTFVSTTETADYLIQALKLRRTPLLEWGPLGMQQLSKVEEGGLTILGFAGNTAPDHIDHLHAYQHFLKLLIGD
ncbi:MAG TPA: hypothetical protein VFM36_09900 [Thermoanaerobaculia bacterium]|nr:hypothetical protein [Thermoanaerobaculia bacterium]